MRPGFPRLALLFIIIGCLINVTVPAQTAAPVPAQTAADSATDQLASALVAAKETEREGLLAAHKELLTVALVSALNKQNRLLIDKGEYARALSVANFVREMAEKLQDQPGIAQSLFSTGVTLTYQGEYKQALEFYRQCLALNETLGDKTGIARVLNALGYVADAMGNYALALEYHHKSLALREALGDKTYIADSLNNLGIVYDSLGEYDQALDYYRRSLALTTALNNKARAAQTLTNIGVVYSARGDYMQAVESYSKALELLEGLDNKRIKAQVLYDLGIAFKLQGDDEQAMEYYRRSLALKEELGNKAGIATTLTAIGAIYDHQGNYQQALENYRQSLQIDESIGNRAGVITTLSNIGAVESELGHTEQAVEFYRRSLAVSDELKEKTHLPVTLNQLAELTFRQGQPAQALEHARRAAAVSQETGNREGLWQSLNVMGRAERALKQTAQAKESFTQAIAVIEDLRARVAGGELAQQRFFENKLAPYQAMMEMLLDEGERGAALAFAERAKARVLLDVLQTGRVNITKAMTATEQERERQINSQLVSLNEQLDKEQARAQPDAALLADLQNRQRVARLEYETFQTTLYAAHPDLKTQRGQTPPFTLDDANALLDDKTALLEFVVSDDNVYLFVLTMAENADARTPRQSAKGEPGTPSAVNSAVPKAAQLAVYPLAIKGKELTAQATNFRRLLAERNLDFQTPARNLYDTLLKPAAKQLQGKTTLCIVPDGALWELPFQALQPADGAYLWDSYAIFYAPSLSVLSRMRAQHAEVRPNLLAFGNPTLSDEARARIKVTERDEPAGSLPEAEKEVQTLAQLYGQTRSEVFTGANAREATFKREAERFRILHFATHSTLDDRAPMYSRIVLASSDTDANEDGMLEAREILRLNLHADLVTLSACQTARGRIGAGEGMIGMSWAFFVAGSPNLVVSQWRVNSASTTDLMIAFHRRLASPGAANSSPHTKAAALREAAQSLLKDKRYRHPFYWAGFVLIGDGR